MGTKEEHTRVNRDIKCTPGKPGSLKSEYVHMKRLEYFCVLRDAPFDFFLGGGGWPRLLLSVMFFFLKKLAHNFFLAPTLKQTFFLSLEKKLNIFL